VLREIASRKRPRKTLYSINFIYFTLIHFNYFISLYLLFLFYEFNDMYTGKFGYGGGSLVTGSRIREVGYRRVCIWGGGSNTRSGYR